MSLEALNPSQRQAVLSEAIRLAIVAGPGTGKTRVLTERIAHFIRDRGADPDRILAITFTNQAAAEMRERLAERLGDGAALPLVCTFHQWGYRFLHQMGTGGAVIGEEDAWLLFLEAAKHHSLDKRDAREAFQAIQQARQSWPVDAGGWGPLLEEYRRLLLHYGLLDYDELILGPLELLEKGGHPELPGFLFVDEFQDVSPAQFHLVRLIAAKGAVLTVIGDPNQSIYGFRGSSPSFMEQFTKWFPEAEIITLDTAYRCPQRFIDGALQVLERHEDLTSSRGTGPLITTREFKSPAAEARWVAETIAEFMGGLDFNTSHAGPHVADSFSDFAVVYRFHALGLEVAEALGKAGIPFQAADGSGALKKEARIVHHSLLALEDAPARGFHVKAVESLAGAEIARRVAEIAGQGGGEEELMAMLTDHGIAGRAARFPGDPSTGALKLKEEADSLDIAADKVKLLTLHAAKGLEFPVVFIVGCDAGILPWPPADVEEEKRLLFVGMTRASRRLLLSSGGRKRFLGQPLPGRPSPFLSRIARELREEERFKARRGRKRSQNRQLSLF